MMRYKDRWMDKVYEACLTAAADPTSEFYLSGGGQRTGAMHRIAFWAGFNGERKFFIGRNTLAWACYQAGKEWRRKQAKLTKSKVSGTIRL